MASGEKQPIDIPDQLINRYLLDDKNLPAEATFDRLTVGQSHRLVRHMPVTREEAFIFCTGNFQHFRADRVDTNSTRHIDRGAQYKTIDGTIGGGGRGATGDWIAIQDTAGESEGATIIDIIETFQQQVYLW